MVTKRKKSHELTAAVLLDVVGWEHTLTAVKLSLPPSLLLFGDQFDDVSSLECKFILMLSSIGVESLELWPSVLLGLFSACSRTSAHQLDIGCREPTNMLLSALGSLRKKCKQTCQQSSLEGNQFISYRSGGLGLSLPPTGVGLLLDQDHLALDERDLLLGGCRERSDDGRQLWRLFALAFSLKI